MKVTLLTRDFSKSLTTASRFVSLRANLPILSNVLLQAEKTKINLLATDLEISFATSIGAKVTDTGEIAVPIRALTEIASGLVSQNIDLETDGETVKLSSEGFTGSLLGVNTSDYPKIERGVSETATELPAASLIPSLNKVLFSVSTDESRPTITGVLFVFSENVLTLVATDGFRLSQKKFKASFPKDQGKLVIPKRVLSEVSRLFAGGQIMFEQRASENQVIFNQNETTLTSRLLDGEFPDFERIMPKATKVTLHVSKEDLARAIKLASIFARDNANIVKVSIKESEMTVSAESSKAGHEETSIPAKIDGEAMELQFNFRYIEEFLNVVSGDTIELKFNDATSPGLFLDPKDTDFLHLIMPVRT